MDNLEGCKTCLCYSCKKHKRGTGCQKCGAIECLKGGLKTCKGYEPK